MTEAHKLFIKNEIGDATKPTTSLKRKILNDTGHSQDQVEEVFQWCFPEQETKTENEETQKQISNLYVCSVFLL